MNEHHFQSSFRSRYYSLGNLSADTKQLWIVFHGYGQLAKYFIKNFSSLDLKSHFIVAPEGIHRFYLSGFDGRVGASWMTKEDRETDIQNYILQLDTLFNNLKSRISNNTLITVLGFSQGTATASRWLSMSRPQIHHLVLWSGKLAHDIDLNEIGGYFSTMDIHILLGDKDEFTDESTFNDYIAYLRQHQIVFKSKLFRGGHKIQENDLLELSASLRR